MWAEEGRRRVIIEGVSPEIDGGRFPIKRIVGDKVIVEADVFTEGTMRSRACSCTAGKRTRRGAKRPWSRW